MPAEFPPLQSASPSSFRSIPPPPHVPLRDEIRRGKEATPYPSPPPPSLSPVGGEGSRSWFLSPQGQRQTDRECESGWDGMRRERIRSIDSCFALSHKTGRRGTCARARLDRHARTCWERREGTKIEEVAFHVSDRTCLSRHAREAILDVGAWSERLGFVPCAAVRRILVSWKRWKGEDGQLRILGSWKGFDGSRMTSRGRIFDSSETRG